MWWMLLLLSPLVFAQSETDLDAIQKLDSELPTFQDYKESKEESKFSRQNRNFRPLNETVSMGRIEGSGTQMVAISAGSPIRKLEDNKNYSLSRQVYVRVFNLEDEHGFKYIQSKDGVTKWRVQTRFAEPIKQELELYEPPLKYTPAPKVIARADYDKKLTVPPEFSFYAGLTQGDYMADLFNDKKAKSGLSNQYGAHLFTNWKLPIKIGAVLHYERTTYDLSNGNNVVYSSISFGPQLKTREFEIFENPIRFQTQFRFSPLARAQAETDTGNKDYKFNATDLMVGAERPIKNGWGEFVLGVYMQGQWLNLKDLDDDVNIKASNKINKSFGISLSQVFQ